jgi:Clp amino terminal domain, pathogenicity island component
MFERYTEKARRVIFFARKEASEFGSPTIESEHILLGLVQESTGFMKRYLGDKTSEAELRAEVLTYTVLRAPTPTSLDLPLSEECKHILMFGAEEAERLGHRHIGTEHLMLGILREENSVAARIFRQHGLELDRARTMLAAAEPEISLRQGIGIGSGTGFSRQPTPSIHVVEAGTSESLLSYNSSLIPRIGDTISVRKDNIPDHSYSVQDVVWEFNRNAGGSVLKDVVVKVVAANSMEEGSAQP